MDDILYNSLNTYFKTLSRVGYISQDQVDKILVLLFINTLISNDYRGIFKEVDYNSISTNLSNLFGQSCLLPYPGHLGSNRLYLGSVGELANRLCELTEEVEENKELLETNIAVTDSNTGKINNLETRVTTIEETKVVKSKSEISYVPDIQI